MLCRAIDIFYPLTPQKTFVHFYIYIKDMI